MAAGERRGTALTLGAAPTEADSAEPAWLRGLAVVDRAYNAFNVVREELALSRIGARQLEAIVAERYGRTSSFYADPGYLERGLHDWERAAVERHFPAPPARLLVGAAGCGREVFALVRLGYEVWAFEPAEGLHAQLVAEAAERKVGTPLVRGGYQELVDGALPEIARGAPFAGVILGWASISHIVSADLRARLLGCLLRLAPGAPVLVSFSPANGLEHGGASGRLRRALRRVLAQLPGAQPVARGDNFGAYGYEHSYDEEELRTLAAAAGYRLVHLSMDGSTYPHAVLGPAAPPG